MNIKASSKSTGAICRCSDATLNLYSTNGDSFGTLDVTDSVVTLGGMTSLSQLNTLTNMLTGRGNQLTLRLEFDNTGTTLNLSTPLVWSNMNSITSISRAQGVTVTWTGGSSNGFVVIDGASSSTSGVGVSFSCYTASSAGQFTIPSYVLDALPAGTGSLGVAGETAFQSFSASGLDYGNAFGSTAATIDSIAYD